MKPIPFQQISGPLLNWASERPFPINGNNNSLVIFKALLDAILKLGEEEHSGDWDPSLRITFMDDSSIETLTGYPEIELDEITKAQYAFYYFTEDYNGDGVESHCKISNIKSITIIP